MAESGFFAQKKASPSSLALVVALHAGALAAVIAIKGPVFTEQPRGPLVTYHVPPQPIPDEIPPPPEADTPLPQLRESVFDAPEPVVQPTVNSGQTVQDRPLPPLRDFSAGAVGPSTAGEVRPPAIPPVAQVVRRAAEFDPRFAAALQPPYPASEERAQREGRVRLRVTIGADGRVKAVTKLSATSDAFYRSAERHALARWRFRPATEDGNPVQSTKDISLTFQLEDR